MSVASDALHVAVFASLPPGDPQTPPLPRVRIGVLPGPSNDPRRSHETTSPPSRNFAPETHRQHLSGDPRTAPLWRPTDGTSPLHLPGSVFWRPTDTASPFICCWASAPRRSQPTPLHLHMHPAPGEDSTSPTISGEAPTPPLPGFGVYALPPGGVISAPLRLPGTLFLRPRDSTSPCVQSQGFPMPGRRGSHTTSPKIT